MGRVEYMSAIRHRDAAQCPISAVAFHLFYRFHVLNEVKPDFSQRKNWWVLLYCCCIPCIP